MRALYQHYRALTLEFYMLFGFFELVRQNGRNRMKFKFPHQEQPYILFTLVRFSEDPYPDRCDNHRGKTDSLLPQL